MVNGFGDLGEGDRKFEVEDTILEDCVVNFTFHS